MTQFIPYSAAKSGQAPGTLTFVGTKRVESPVIEIIRFGPEAYEHQPEATMAMVREFKEKPDVKWINVTGVHDDGVIREIGEIFDIHPLHLEDVMNTRQRAQFQDSDDYFFCIIRMLEATETMSEITNEQVSLITGKGFVISFQEAPGDTFDSVRQRIARQTTRIRQRSADYLAFALMDAIVDEYVLIAEQLRDRVSSIENEMLLQVKYQHLDRIRRNKSKFNFLSKSIRPAREMVVQLERSETILLDDKTLPYLSDLEGHIVQAIESLELTRERLGDLLDFYDMALNHRLNDSIRVLTIFSVIFIPLTFLAGIYGMNFEHMPELGYPYAYPMVLVVMVLIVAGMIAYFRRKKWL